MKNTILTVISFIVITLGAQGMSHFVINVDYYAALGLMRSEPVMALGFVAMIVQALIISLAMSQLYPAGATLTQGLCVSACFGLFLGSYILLAEPAKFEAPSILMWMKVEGMTNFIQFAVFGLLLGLIYRKKQIA